MSKKTSQHKKHTNDMGELGFAGRLMAGQSPSAAWQEIRASLQADPMALEIVRELHKSDPDVAESSRREWSEQGLKPPWEGLL